MRWLSRLISVILIAAVVVLFGLWIRSKMPATKVGDRFTTCALFRDASKLATGSPVMIAGVRVGEVSNLSVDGELARIEMRLRDDTKVPIDSWVTKRAYSPFGDSYIEIIPGGPDESGAPTGQMLTSGVCLRRVAEGSSTDRLLRQVERTMPRVEDGLDRLHEVGLAGRKWASGTLEDRILDAERWLDSGKVEGPLDSADQALARLESGAQNAASAFAGTQPSFDKTFDKIQKGVTEARKRMAQVTTDLRDGLISARGGMNDVDPTIADMQELVAAINEGRGSGAKGTLGRLINDPELGDQLEDATAALHEGVASFSRFKSWLGLRFEFGVFSRQPRFFVTAEVRARTDKFYLVELEKGPEGDFPDDKISDATNSGTWYRRQQITDRVRFTAQFGKTFGGWFQVRGGVKESTFGIGTDVLVRDGRLTLSADLYGGYTRTPRLKLAAALAVFRSIYVVAGVDDTLTTPRYLNILDTATVPSQFDKIRIGRDYFLGATLHFDDADLAVLLRVYGALLVGLL